MSGERGGQQRALERQVDLTGAGPVQGIRSHHPRLPHLHLLSHQGRWSRLWWAAQSNLEVGGEILG